CVEFFLTADNQLLLNEMAPRPHNSGHLTIDACVTSQFEQQLRAICGLPLGDPSYHHPAAMANLLGEHLLAPDLRGFKRLNVANLGGLLTNPAIKLHLYGKEEARPGRKMGHLTALATTAAEAAIIVREARGKLDRSA
ncbi:MAG: ATP-grasp domain-containing protein, partial [Anaerolineae bacterium]|nr:ATP-grasp domain-containing protein [Anaerolineae bacterium]